MITIQPTNMVYSLNKQRTIILPHCVNNNLKANSSIVDDTTTLFIHLLTDGILIRKYKDYTSKGTKIVKVSIDEFNMFKVPRNIARKLKWKTGICLTFYTLESGIVIKEVM